MLFVYAIGLLYFILDQRAKFANLFHNKLSQTVTVPLGVSFIFYPSKHDHFYLLLTSKILLLDESYSKHKARSAWDMEFL